MNTPAIHPRDLIAGLQKGLALMQLFSAEQPRLTPVQRAIGRDMERIYRAQVT